MAGVNQTLMMTLSMVVVASMIGAPGLGNGIYVAVSRNEVGNGFVAGISIVILAHLTRPHDPIICKGSSVIK